jgi:hypothetical protein
MNETRATHTPGPWSRTPGERFRHDSSAGVKGPNGLYVATALDFNRLDREDEVEANANLIAAAPDLLEACEWLASWIDNEHPIWDLPDDIEICQLRQRLEEALAKARGEEPGDIGDAAAPTTCKKCGRAFSAQEARAGWEFCERCEPLAGPTR